MAPFDVHVPPFVPKASTFRRGTPAGPPVSAPAYPRCPPRGEGGCVTDGDSDVAAATPVNAGAVTPRLTGELRPCVTISLLFFCTRIHDLTWERRPFLGRGALPNRGPRRTRLHQNEFPGALGGGGAVTALPASGRRRACTRCHASRRVLRSTSEPRRFTRR